MGVDRIGIIVHRTMSFALLVNRVGHIIGGAGYKLKRKPSLVFSILLTYQPVVFFLSLSHLYDFHISCLGVLQIIMNIICKIRILSIVHFVLD